jgi:hypothetical protein
MAYQVVLCCHRAFTFVTIVTIVIIVIIVIIVTIAWQKTHLRPRHWSQVARSEGVIFIYY